MEKKVRTQAARVLRDAEEQLRLLISEAATDGAGYDDLSHVIATASALNEMVGQIDGDGTGVDAETAPSNAPHQVSSRSPSRTRRRRRKGTYPRFELVGDHLVKTGWSKKDKREFVHRVPRESLELIEERLRAVAARKTPFAMPDVLPVPKPNGRGEIPTYQVYVAIAYLVEQGTVSKHGRADYSLATG